MGDLMEFICSHTVHVLVTVLAALEIKPIYMYEFYFGCFIYFLSFVSISKQHPVSKSPNLLELRNALHPIIHTYTHLVATYDYSVINCGCNVDA